MVEGFLFGTLGSFRALNRTMEIYGKSKGNLPPTPGQEIRPYDLGGETSTYFLFSFRSLKK